MSQDLSHLPAVHQLLELEALREARERIGHGPVADACRAVLGRVRDRIADGTLSDVEITRECAAIPERVMEELEASTAPAYPTVINATGVLLHTNLGRAPLAELPRPLQASYLALEYDLETGRRGQRLAPLGPRLARVCGAESAVMVNNNAAALVLMLACHARAREVAVSRGQLIEIGGSFRLPEVMAAAGVELLEVGCTNRTHLRDYADALDRGAGAVLLAHRSNFQLTGFTTDPPVAEVARIAHDRGVPLMVDQGSGALHDLGRWGLDHQQTVAELLAAGADLVCFSGDKLLGGPQAGVVVGAATWVDPLARHPLYRALRPDKAALVWMDHALAAHASGRLDRLPLYAMLQQPVEGLKRRAQRSCRRLRREGIEAHPLATACTVGGGTTPGDTIPSWAVSLEGGARLLHELRRGRPPVVGRIERDRVVLDLRTVPTGEDRRLVVAVQEATSRAAGRRASGR